MTKEYCDRCHREITERKIFNNMIICKTFMNGYYEKGYDLCPKCYKELEKFIHNYKATDKMEE